MMIIGSSVDYVRSGGLRNVPVMEAVEHLHATTTKFSRVRNLGLTSCVLLPATSELILSTRAKIGLKIIIEDVRTKSLAGVASSS
ncbi:hypothetical protein AVEN_239461-1 [Araneus ventricosus]|uniref:Uncharacterized protein n=1 Tax=Araneus ventricosus TaxID=182803 RepID=A0A4Y2N722_ARAVE|nr:hypothetical protein AVEN_239461-1 [Araneus ventricosus]